MDVHPIKDLQERYLLRHDSRQSSPSTIARYNMTFLLFDRFLAESGRSGDSRSLTNDTMMAFAVWLRNEPVRPTRGSTQRSIAGVHAHLRDIRAWLRFLEEERLLEERVKVEFPKLPDHLFPILSDQELERVWTSRYLTGKSDLATRNRAMLGLMIDTGLRRGEVVALQLEDVDLRDHLLTVTGKGKKQRRVPFSTSVRVLLEEWFKIRGDEPGSVFWLQAQGIRMVFRSIQNELGLARFYPHQMRHQSATMLVRNHADVATVQRILGHSDISTTLQYLSLSDEDLRNKHAAASPFEKLQQQSAVVEMPARRKRLSLKAT